MKNKLYFYGFYCKDCKRRFLGEYPEFRHAHTKMTRVVGTNEMIDTYVELGTPIPFPKDDTIRLEPFARFEVDAYEYEHSEKVKAQLRYELRNHPVPIPNENN